MSELRLIDRELAKQPDATRVVRLLLAFAVDGSVPTEPAKVSAATVEGLVRGRVTSLFLAAVDAGVFVVDESVMATLPSPIELAAKALGLESVCAEITALLGRHGIPVLVLKGLATSQLDYRDPGLRDTSDVDILVPPDRFDEALEVLIAGPCERRHVQGLDPVWVKGETLLHSSGIEIDLHLRLFVLFPKEQEDHFAMVDALPNETGGAMTASMRFVHAAGHLLGSRVGPGRKLSSLVDLATMIGPVGLPQSASDVDWQVVGRVAANLGMDQVVQRSIEIEHALSARPGAAARITSDRLFDPAAIIFLRMPRGATLAHLGLTVLMPTWGDRVRYLRAWLLPSAEVRQAHGGSWWSYFSSLPSRAR